MRRCFPRCEAQDKKFALIYTITSLVYATPAILVGYMIHYCGLAASRITAASLIVIGFACLGLTTKEYDSLLNISMIALAFGGNQLRLSGFQFCNLFPKYRSTALTLITGSYAASAGLFMTFQFGQQYGISLWHMCSFFAFLASGSIFFTFIMPWHHIPYDQPNEAKSNQDWRRDGLPVVHSLLSLSSFTHSLWVVLIMSAIIYFNTSFNSWISKISQSNEEAGHYSLLFSASAFLCPLISPLPGIITDYMSKRVSSGNFLLHVLDLPDINSPISFAVRTL
ncbi:Solute carrier family 43 member 3 [Armadillidium vulgare]|nr:Solute carrier family 43 member 3 [Armadillidium vulgare]